MTIGNTILKTGVWGGNISNYGTVTSLVYNLSDDDGGDFLTATGDQINIDPMLGPLQDNGGPTFTHELLAGSPAIDAGDPSFTPPPDYDQRGSGYSRVANARVDIGAFEVQPVAPGHAAQVQPPISADGTSVFSSKRGLVPVKFNLTQAVLRLAICRRQRLLCTERGSEVANKSMSRFTVGRRTLAQASGLITVAMLTI